MTRVNNSGGGERLDCPTTVDRIVESLLAYQPDKIILFGSVARGDADEHSDIDVIVVKKSDKRFVERLVEVLSYVPRDLRGADVLVYTPEEFHKMQEAGNPFIERALKDGVVLYENPQRDS